MGLKRQISLNRYLRTYAYVSLFLLFMGGIFFVGCSKPEVHKVGILSGLDYVTSIADSFQEKMVELGYMEGENILYDLRRVDFDMEEYRKILQEFVDNKVDLVLVFPTEAS